LTRGLSWLVTLAIARALAPEQFGLIAICWTVHNAAVLVRDQAVTSTLVRATQSGLLRASVNNLCLALSLVVAVGVAALGPPVSSLLDQDATPLLVLFAAAFTVSSIGAVPTSILQRSLRFRTLSLVEMASTGAYVLTAVLLVLGDVGPSAVGWGQLVGAVVGSIGVLATSSFRPSLRFSLREVRSVARYSAGSTAIAILAFAFANIDTLWVAAHEDARELGYYTLAFNVAFVFAMTLTQVVQKVAFSAHATLEDQPGEDRRLLVASVRLVLAVSLPVAWVLAMFAEPIVERVFGNEYAGTTSPLQVLAVYGLIASTAAPMSSYLRARSRLRVVVIALALQLGVAATLLPLAIGRWSGTGAAVAVTIAIAVGSVPVIAAACRLAGIAPRNLGAAMPHWATIAVLAGAIALRAMSDGWLADVAAAAGFVLLAARIPLPRRHVRLHVPRPIPTPLIVAVALLTAMVAGAGAALAPVPLLAAGAALIVAYVASAHLRAAALAVVFISPVAPIGLYVELSPALPLVTVARAAIGILVLAAFIAFLRGDLAVRRWALWVPLVLWLIAAVASYPGSIDAAATRLRVMSEVLETAALAGVIYSVFDRASYRRVLEVLVAGAGVGAVFAIAQVAGVDLLDGVRARAAAVSGRGNSLVDTGDVRLGFVRAQGSFQTPSFLGATMAMAAPLAYGLAVTAPHAAKRWWYACSVVILGALMVSVTRGAWIVAAFGLAVVVLTAARRGYATLRHAYWTCTAVVFALVVEPGLVRAMWSLIAQLFDTRADATTSTTNYRLFLHEQVLETVRERPWFGFGAGTFDRLGISGVNRGLLVELRSADSHLLRLAAEVGWVGVAAFAALLAVAVVDLWRKRRLGTRADCVLMTAVIAAAVGYIAVNLTISAFPIAQTAYFFWIAVAAAAASPFGPPQIETHDHPRAQAPVRLPA
jgi:PST family polysaccharide transporter